MDIIMTGKQTNIEFLTEIMEFSNNGVLMQMLVMEGINKYIDFIIENQEDVRTSISPLWDIIDKEDWIRTAKEFRNKYDQNYKTDNNHG